MPIYEYQCLSCGKTFEVLQHINETTPIVCEYCGAKKLKRLVPKATNFALKGSGWYETDFKNGDGGGSHGSTQN